MKRVRIAIAVVCIALAGSVGWQVMKSCAEPVYKGRTLTSWLRDKPDAVDDGGWEINREAQRAVRQIGTNAIPTLLCLLRAKDSALKIRMLDWLDHQQVIHVHLTRAFDSHFLGQKGFQFLGTNAQGAVPELIQIYEQDIYRDSRLFVILSLGQIKPPPEQVAPSMLQWLINSDSKLRRALEVALDKIAPSAGANAGIHWDPNHLWIDHDDAIRAGLTNVP